MRSKGHRVESTCAVLRQQGVRVAGRSYRVWRRRPASIRTIDEGALIGRFHRSGRLEDLDELIRASRLERERLAALDAIS